MKAIDRSAAARAPAEATTARGVVARVQMTANAAAALLFLATPGPSAAQSATSTATSQRSQQQPSSMPRVPPTARSMAQTNLTGYWVSVVTEDWRYRMTAAPKEDFGGIPATAAAREAARVWERDEDSKEGRQCAAFGAAGIMRQPGRLHITWADEKTLKIDFDSGTQTRLLNFSALPYPMGFTGVETPLKLRRYIPPDGIAPSVQGYTVASWQKYFDGRGFAGMGTGGGLAVPSADQGGTLMALTTRLLPGYLRSNGVPYSDETLLTEYFNKVKSPSGEEWLVVTSIVEDPKYLYEPYITSTNFKREADGSRWHPLPCQVAAPTR